LLFAGGRGDFIEKYVEAYAWWHERGWNVTAFDWRSQGGSRGDIRGGHLEDFDPLVADMAALIGDWARETPGPHVAVAHSMGGHLLMRTLAERKPALDAAVLVAPMLMINSASLPSHAASGMASFLSLFGWARQPAWPQPDTPAPRGSTRQRILTGCPDRYEDELWWWEKKPGFNLGVPTWGWLKAAYRSCDTLTDEKLRRMETPILLIGTDKDRLVSPDAIRRAASVLPKAELLMFDEAAHEILREADDVRLTALRAIDDFLARHAA
jgi:lysophospholipase